MNALKMRSGVSSATFSISTPPSGLDHQDGPLGRAIDDEAEVQLARDLEALLDEHAADDPALGPGLVRDERHAEHGLRGGARGVRALDDLDAAALAAAAGVNLRLDDDRAAAELDGGGRASSIGVNATLALGHGHAERLEDLFALIFVNLHRRSVREPSWSTALDADTASVPDGGRRLHERRLLVGGQLDLDDLLRAALAELDRHAEELVADAVLALSRNTEHGRITFLSLRMASTISAAAAPGAYQALVPTSFVISAPPLAVRVQISSSFAWVM